MRVMLLAIGGVFLLAGCSSNDQRGAVHKEYSHKEYYLTEGGAYGWQTEGWETEERTVDPRTGPWAEGWGRTGGPDRIAPTIALDPLFPPAPPR